MESDRRTESSKELSEVLEVYRSLERQFHGDLLRPADTLYETARGIWNGMVARRPGLIARCADVQIAGNRPGLC